MVRPGFSIAVLPYSNGAGLSILNSTSVSITGLTVLETGGDCIYVGAHSSNITVQGCNLTAGYRNAMSVTGVVGLLVQDSVLADTGGTCCMVRSVLFS